MREISNKRDREVIFVCGKVNILPNVLSVLKQRIASVFSALL